MLDWVGTMITLNKLMTVRRPTPTTGAYGTSRSMSDHLTNVPCHVRWRSAAEQMRFGKETPVTIGQIRCAVLDIVSSDFIYLDSVLYKIIEVLPVGKLQQKMLITITKENSG